MFDVTTFLIRWLFLSKLVRDVAEIQTLPCQPYYHPSQSAVPSTPASSRHEVEEVWRDECVRGIMSYPPGLQRLMVMDAVRLELVHQLAWTLRQSTDVLKQRTLSGAAVSASEDPTVTNPNNKDEMAQGTAPSTPLSRRTSSHSENVDDPYFDADLEILNSFGQHDDPERSSSVPSSSTKSLAFVPRHQRQATLVISRDESTVMDDTKVKSTVTSTATNNPSSRTPPTWEEIQQASKHLRDVKDYLPQLVAALLRAPPALLPQYQQQPPQQLAHMEVHRAMSDPIQQLRRVILKHCVDDPGFGIDLCWLLEAEVGRAWKTLFEHRQQTGRRLIVVLPAEKAAVLAQIGTEKRGAFDLLQDAEQATAYGYLPTSMREHDHHPPSDSQYDDETDMTTSATRLPSSLSLRRCGHFGDTMHFIDRLTKVSLDLRLVPVPQRMEYLHRSLEEMNRRIRRRMVTRGDVSLDVEDLRGPNDWPSLDDLTLDMLQYSVHFPLAPQAGLWPSGETSPVTSPPSSATDPPPADVVRVLNIVVPESRLLASRERCPFLVHMEVADTGLGASDARLYASRVPNLGSTLEEAMAMSPAASSASAALRHSSMPNPAYGVPMELIQSQKNELDLQFHGLLSPSMESLPPRGGSQSDEMNIRDDIHTDWMNPSPYDAFRQLEYEQLHMQMQGPGLQYIPQHPAAPSMERISCSTGNLLLDQVFGQQWQAKCQEIRSASPFGHVKGWRLASFIMKAGEDIRREALVMQVISKLKLWFAELPEKDRPFMRPYTIMIVGGDAGMIECLSDAKSVDEVKKKTDSFSSLRNYFERAYGPPNSSVHTGTEPNHPITFEQAQDNFLRSLVGYSLVCYILQIKDRHNANILLDRYGHIMHIDFGFVLGDTPKMGKVPIFSERAPFKLSSEFWEVLGGWNVKSGGLGVRFCSMFEKAFACASSHADELATLVEGIMELLTSDASAARAIANGVRHRLRMRGPIGSKEQQNFVVELVNTALTSWGTSTYDWLQRSMNGYQ